MKFVLIASLVTLFSFQTQAIEKDRGGEVVPYAEGHAAVMLSRTYARSIVTLEGPAAKLLFDALTTAATPNTDPFAQVGQNLMKIKDNVKCVGGTHELAVYKCTISINN